jgi:multiple sugar transport system permease protein
VAADREASGVGSAPPGGPTTVPVGRGREDVPVGRRGGGPNMKRRQVLAGWLLLSPALALYVAFIGIPLIGVILISFVQWDLVSPPRWVGTANFQALAHDPQLARSLLTSFLFDIMTTSIHIVVGMGLAIAVTTVRSRVVRYWARTAFVAPFLMSAGVVALMWSYILNGESGPLNYYLRLIGISPPNWFGSNTWALPGLVIIDVWATVGLTFLIFLVGLQNIPSDLYESASIDGSGSFARFRFITLPMLSPATFVASVTAFIGAYEIFTWPLIDTNGGPGTATQTILLYIYREAFQDYRFGYSAVISLVNILILLSFLVIMTVLAKKWVHYERV